MGNASSQIMQTPSVSTNPIFSKIQHVLDTNTEMYQVGHGLDFKKGDKFRTKDGKTGTVLERRSDLHISGHSNSTYYHVVFDNGSNETMFPGDSMINVEDELKREREIEKRKEEEHKRKEEEHKRREEEEHKRREREKEEREKREEERKRREEENKRREEERERREEENKRREEERKIREEENKRKEKEEHEKKLEEENRRREEEHRKREEENKRREEENRRREEENRKRVEEENKRREEERQRKVEQENKRKEKEREEIKLMINKNNLLVNNFENLIKTTSGKISVSNDKDRFGLTKKLEEYEREKLKYVNINKELERKI
jgi:hypothetical protein